MERPFSETPARVRLYSSTNSSLAALDPSPATWIGEMTRWVAAPGTSPPHCPLELESPVVQALLSSHGAVLFVCTQPEPALQEDRKSTRLNSSHDQISYAVFCLKKKHIRYI